MERALLKVKERLLNEGIVLREGMTGRECTSFRTGGELPFFAEPADIDQAAAALRIAEETGTDHFLIGNGSNLLIPDEGSEKLFIRLSGKLKEYALEGPRLVCGAGASLAAASKYSVAEGFSGLEWAAGIPGTVGGAAAMNASAYGGEIKAVLKSVTAYRGGEVSTFDIDPSLMGYRKSFYSFPNMTVLRAVFELEPDDGGAKERMEYYSQRRKASQPLNYPSAGSTFKRPEGYYAGALIEQSGLKGARVGGACVSEKHAGFIINDDGATSEDVVSLMEVVRNTVYSKFGVTLEPEVIVLR